MFSDRLRSTARDRFIIAGLAALGIGAFANSWVEAEPAGRGSAWTASPPSYAERAARFVQAPDAIALAEARVMIDAAHELEGPAPSACVDLLSGVRLAEAERRLSRAMRQRRLAVVRDLMARPPDSAARITTADEELAALSDASSAISRRIGVEEGAFVIATIKGDDLGLCRTHVAILEHVVADDPAIAAGMIRRIYATAQTIDRP